MQIIENLLHIKLHRERQAEWALARATRALRAAADTVELANQNLIRAHREHDANKISLYNDLFSRLVQLSDLDIARSKLEKMDADVKQCEVALSVASKKMDFAERVREEARLHYRQSFKTREKYSELSVQALSRKKHEQARTEENEIEEILIKPRDGSAMIFPEPTETAA